MIHSKLVSSLERVFPDREPSAWEGGFALRGERVNFQLAFYNEGTPLVRCSVEAEGELAANISVRRIVFLPYSYTHIDRKDDYYLENSSGLIPELLAPFDSLGLVLPTKQWCAVWVSLDVPAWAKGNYETIFSLKDGNGNVLTSLSVKEEIIEESLEKSDLVVTNWVHYDCIANAHGVEPFSEGFYLVFKEYLKAYVAIGNNMLLTPIFTPPLDTEKGGERRTVQLVKVEISGGKYLFDFTEFEKFVRFAQENGIEYFEFSHLFTQWGGECCPKIVATREGKEERIFGWENDSLSEEYAAFLKAFFRAFLPEIAHMGLENRCFFHLTDEPPTHSLPRYEALRKMVKGEIGRLPTMDAMSDPDYYARGLVDVPVALLNAYPKFVGVHAEKLFVYNCCETTHSYESNRLMNMPLQRGRVLGYQLYETGVQGFLHWGFNFYNTAFSYGTVDPYRDTSAGGMLPSGDSFIVYPYEKGVLYSMRAETVREAFQDYRALKTLERKIGREKVLALLHEEGIQGYSEYPRSAERHLAFRGRINSLIKGE